jgi:hypothetical protein
MDGPRFDVLTRRLNTTGSRRVALRLLAAGPLGVALALPEHGAGATHFGCKHKGRRCSTPDQCCSGICRKRRCRAHHVGSCQRGKDTCTASTGNAFCGESGACECYVTTGGARFCGRDTTAFCPDSDACARDPDCGAGNACVTVGTDCTGCTNSPETFCIEPCNP